MGPVQHYFAAPCVSERDFTPTQLASIALN
jgi:hypothetical protein